MVLLTQSKQVMKFPTEVIQDLENAKPIPGSTVSGFEIPDPHNEGEYIFYDVFYSDKYIFVGGVCNTGLLLDTYLERDNTFSLDEELEAVFEAILDSAFYKEELPIEIDM